MEITQTYKEQPGPETVWAILQEVARSQKETDRLIKELGEKQEEGYKKLEKMQEETARQIEETAREMKESAKRLDKQMGKLGNRFGDMVEHMVMPALLEKFSKLGLVFDDNDMAPNQRFTDYKNGISLEVDVFLENNDTVMLAEVKSKLSTEDVSDHVERMKKMRKYIDIRGDNRKLLGAIAAMVMDDETKKFALKNGFYVAEPSGETFNIIVPEGNYSLREW